MGTIKKNIKDKADTEFITYCLQLYQNENKKNPREISAQFEKYNVYEYLNTFGDIIQEYSDSTIIETINGVIQRNKLLQANGNLSRN